MIISPFTPLFFLADHKTDGLDCEYMQTFAPTDRILLEIFDPGREIEDMGVTIQTVPDGKIVSEVPLSFWEINENNWLHFASLSFSPGFYKVSLRDMNVESEPFRVTDDKEILKNTTLIQYSMKNNRQRLDAVFFIQKMQYFFDFRVPGGFKDSGWTFGVESEQFVTQHGNVSQLYGLETVHKTFTLGGGQGVPVWYAELLNRILTCTHVYFDGVKYARKDTSVPEMSQQLDGVNSFVFTQTLQKAVNLDPVLEAANQVLLRKVYDKAYRITVNGHRKI